MVKRKLVFAIGFTFTVLMGIFNSIFYDSVVTNLKFTPISWLHGLSDRNLRRDDFTDCSFIFFFILRIIAIRQNDQKALGFAPSRAVSKAGGMFLQFFQPSK